MARRKSASGSASKKTPSKRPQTKEPIRDRPRLPSIYGVSRSTKGLLPWSHVEERMDKAMRYWVSSVDGGGRPHATPIDGMWVDGKLYFGGDPTTRRHRNLVANPAACIHLEEAMDVVILHGDARELRGVSRELNDRLKQASKDKYGWVPPVEDLGAGGVFVFEPRLVFAWKDMTRDATRFRFPSRG
jgi:nitroimidazol reductase NimA-like FMN-containing flavoprotein (pyridoxamine 5'-phosphate oxidase superfamily)